MTRAGKLFTFIFINTAAFTPVGFHTFSILALVILLMGEKRRKQFLSLLFKDG